MAFTGAVVPFPVKVTCAHIKFCDGMEIHVVKLIFPQWKTFLCHSKKNNFISVHKANSVTVTFAVFILHSQKSYKPKALNVLVNDEVCPQWRELTFPPVLVGGRWLFSKTLQTSKMYFCFKTKKLICRTPLYSLLQHLFACRQVWRLASFPLPSWGLDEAPRKGALGLCSAQEDVSKGLPRHPVKRGKVITLLEKPGTQRTFQKQVSSFPCSVHHWQTTV